MVKQLEMWETNMMSCMHLHLSCMTLILSLTVQKGLKEIGSFVKSVRQQVMYVASSPTKTRKFKDYCERETIDCDKSLSLDVLLGGITPT